MAVQLFTQSIQTAQTVNAERIVLGSVAGMAGVALALGQAKRAARLLGAVEAARVAIGVARPAHALHSERIAAQAREQLGEQAFAVAFAAGRATPFTEALVDALAVSPAGHPMAGAPAEASRVLLTARELDVLRLLVEGRSDKEIAAALFIGPRTVQTHVSNLFAKLGVNTRAEAAAVAVRRGIV
jgi:DNA-binding CsgD family transcriptional regulator